MSEGKGQGDGIFPKFVWVNGEGDVFLERFIERLKGQRNGTCGILLGYFSSTRSMCT
jgi:hypothetical protein